MGGNALKTTETKRIPRQEYSKLEQEVLEKLGLVAEKHRLYYIPKVLQDKTDYGDLDSVIYAPKDQNIEQRIREVFQPLELIRNGNMFSLNYKGYQVDILTYRDVMEPDFASHYLAYSDLGGMMSQLWKPFGFILRDRGLFYQLRDVENPSLVIEEVLVTNDWATVCHLMGIGSYPHYRGFETRDEVFKWLAGSHLFDPNLYFPSNLNSEQRKRKEARPMYQDFLRWIGTNFPSANGKKPTVTPRDHQVFLGRITGEVPEFGTRLLDVIDAHKNDQDWKRSFNGKVASEKTGYTGDVLGRFMRFVNAKVTGWDRVKVSKFKKQDYDLWFNLMWKQFKDSECLD